jgi:hypothetical protein
VCVFVYKDIDTYVNVLRERGDKNVHRLSFDIL